MNSESNPYVYILAESVSTSLANPAGLMYEIISPFVANCQIIPPGSDLTDIIKKEPDKQQIALVFNHDLNSVKYLNDHKIPCMYFPLTSHPYQSEILSLCKGVYPLTKDLANQLREPIWPWGPWFVDPYQSKIGTRVVVGVIGDIEPDSIVYKLAQARPEIDFHVTGRADKKANVFSHNVHSYLEEHQLASTWDIVFMPPSLTPEIGAWFATGRTLPYMYNSDTSYIPLAYARSYQNYNTALDVLDKIIAILPSIDRDYLSKRGTQAWFITSIKGILRKAVSDS